ncbi:MAG: hypothetical protein K2O19_02770, partial [Malacoplasma sp.]|nr:hypothetical protein [Malacoplasma sp.]
MVYFLEAPIIFSEDSSKKITRIMPVSGRKYIYDKVDLLLADLGIEHYYAGGFGSAQVISSANNILKSTVALGVFEAISYAIGNNLDLNLLFDAVKNGAGGSNLLTDFYDFFKKDKFISLTNNFIGSANQIEIALSDNKKNREEFLLTKIVNGILKREENNSISIDLDLFVKFYNLNLTKTAFENTKHNNFLKSNPLKYEENINYEFENEINNNKFEADFLVGDEKDFFDKTIQKNESINKSDDFTNKTVEKKSSIEKDNLTEINNLNNSSGFDETATDFYSENFFNFNDEKNNQNENTDFVSNQEKQKIYESPESLKETKLDDNLKNHFIDKVDEEYGSLLP